MLLPSPLPRQVMIRPLRPGNHYVTTLSLLASSPTNFPTKNIITCRSSRGRRCFSSWDDIISLNSWKPQDKHPVVVNTTRLGSHPNHQGEWWSHHTGSLWPDMTRHVHKHRKTTENHREPARNWLIGVEFWDIDVVSGLFFHFLGEMIWSELNKLFDNAETHRTRIERRRERKVRFVLYFQYLTLRYGPYSAVY